MKSMEKQHASGQSWQRRGIFALVSKRPAPGGVDPGLPQEDDPEDDLPEQ